MSDIDIDDEPRQETRVIVPPRGGEDEEIVIGPVALDDCDKSGSQVRHRWPSGDGEPSYAEGIVPEHLDQVRATMVDLALHFYMLGWTHAGGADHVVFDDGLQHAETPMQVREALATMLAAGVDVAL